MYDALKRKEFRVRYQPIYKTETGLPECAEALVRWHIHGDAALRPAEFISIFEKCGFIVKLDYYIWEEVCREMRMRMKGNVPIGMVYLCGAMLGFADGAVQMPMGASAREVLGTRDFAKKMGIVGGGCFLGVSFSTVIVAAMFDATGSYNSAFIMEPKTIRKQIDEIADDFTAGKLLVSVAAGIAIDFFEEHLGEDAMIVRVMPNMLPEHQRRDSTAATDHITSEIH